MSYKFDPRVYQFPGSFSTSRALKRSGHFFEGDLQPREAVAAALPLVAYPTRQIRRLEARRRAKEAAKRLSQEVAP